MEFRYREDQSKSSSEESEDRSEQNDERSSGGSGRSYECVFCKRGFTTAQALGGHMNIHRKDRAKTKPNFPPNSASSTKVDDDTSENYVDLGFYSAISTHPTPNCYSPHEVDELYDTHNNINNYHQISFPAVPPCGGITGVQNQRGLSLYSNLRPNQDKVEDSTEEDGLDLELRLGYHP